MKVCELIKKLQQLDQEKEIFILYDTYAFLEPEPINYVPDKYEAVTNECYIMEAS